MLSAKDWVCVYLFYLRYLSAGEQLRLSRAVFRFPVEAFPVAEWNGVG